MGAEVDPERLPPTERKAWYQSENERVKLEKELASLLDVEDVHRNMSALVKAAVATLDGLPDILERDIGLPPEAVQRVQELVDALREQMYRAIIDDGD